MSELYDRVMANDAKRDALKKKPAKPGMHPRGDRQLAARVREQKKDNKPAGGERRTVESPRPVKVTGELASKTMDAQRRADAAKADAAPRPGGVIGFIKERNAAFLPNVKKDIQAVQNFRAQSKETLHNFFTKNAKNAKSDDKSVVGTAEASTPAPMTRPVADRGDNTRQTKASPNPSSSAGKAPAPKTVKAKTPSKPKGSAGEASNRDLGGRSSVTYRSRDGSTVTKTSQDGKGDLSPPPKVTSGTKSNPLVAAAKRSNGPGGGADAVLATDRGATRLARMKAARNK